MISFLCKKKGKCGQHKIGYLIGYIRKSEQNFLRLNIHSWSLILRVHSARERSFTIRVALFVERKIDDRNIEMLPFYAERL